MTGSIFYTENTPINKADQLLDIAELHLNRRQVISK